MPLLIGRRLRKRWRWVGAFAENLIVFAATVGVGPGLDDLLGNLGPRAAAALGADQAGPAGQAARGGDARAGSPACAPAASSSTSSCEGSEPIECFCPNGEGGYTWTRKAAGMPVHGEVRIGRRTSAIEGRGVADDSAGYHRRYTSWKWSAGVGTVNDGRTVAWNLVEGINDPPHSSERAIWVSGFPTEPGPVRFQGLDAIHFEDESRLNFTAETQRSPPRGHPAARPLRLRGAVRALQRAR